MIAVVLAGAVGSLVGAAIVHLLWRRYFKADAAYVLANLAGVERCIDEMSEANKAAERILRSIGRKLHACGARRLGLICETCTTELLSEIGAAPPALLNPANMQSVAIASLGLARPAAKV